MKPALEVFHDPYRNSSRTPLPFAYTTKFDKYSKDKGQKSEIVSVRIFSFYFEGSKLVTFLAKTEYCQVNKIGSCHRKVYLKVQFCHILRTCQNVFTKCYNFLEGCYILAKNLTHFDPPKQKLNNLTDTNLYDIYIKLDDVMTTSERYIQRCICYVFVFPTF